MLDSNDLETMTPVARAKELLEAFKSQPGSITKDRVTFINDVQDPAELKEVAEILLSDKEGLLSNNARAVVLKASGKWKPKYIPRPLLNPYQSAYDTP